MSQTRSDDGLVRIIVVILGIILLFPLLMMVFAMPMMGMMGWWWGDGMTNTSPLWGIGMLLIWLIILVGIGYFLYQGLIGRLRTDTTDPALEELRLAYARGDLTDEEFENRRQRLERE